MPSPSPLPSVDFLGLRLYSSTTEELIGGIASHGANCAEPWVVGYLNAAQVNLAFDSIDFTNSISKFDCLYADGKGVVWAAEKLGSPVAERVNAGDFTHRFFEASAKAGLKIALVGSEAGVAKDFAAHFQGRVPGLDVCFVSDGYFPEGEQDAILRALDEADPDIVLLGMGSPRQEGLALAWSKSSARPRVWWCVGALFEYSSGRRRAPSWVREVGLEWLFRLMLEPRRLWKRYLIGNPVFIGRVLRGEPIPGVSYSRADSGADSGADSATDSGADSGTDSDEAPDA